MLLVTIRVRLQMAEDQPPVEPTEKDLLLVGLVETTIKCELKLIFIKVRILLIMK